jgi:hypothetical protein
VEVALLAGRRLTRWSATKRCATICGIETQPMKLSIACDTVRPILGQREYHVFGAVSTVEKAYYRRLANTDPGRLRSR